MSSIIFYAVSQNLRENFSRWYESGLRPVCIVDANMVLHHTFYDTPGGGIEILPLLEAITRYPDYCLYLTMRENGLTSVYKYLLGIGVPGERIRFCEPCEWRLGCRELDSFVRVSGKRFFTCCFLEAQRKYLTVPMQDDFNTTFNKYNKIVANTIEKLRNKMPCVCDDCPSLYQGIWRKEMKIDTLVLDGWFKDDVCNLKCFYCGQMQKSGNEKYTLLDAAKQLADLFPHIKKWFYTGGELSVYPKKRELYDIAVRYGWKLLVSFTNAVIYDEFFSDEKTSYRKINCSLDCGLRETYLKIKGADCFDKVLNNLRQYRENGCDVTLKYVIMEDVNDDPANIDSFLNIASSLACKVSLSFNQDATPIITLDCKIWQSITYFIDGVNSRDLQLQYETWPLSQTAIREMGKLLNNNISAIR
jgi:pyruvate-formate lyase-activating enzyme